MVNKHQKFANELLRNRILVLWVLAGLKREDSEYDDVARRLRNYTNLEPVLERAAKGNFPSEGELNTPIPEFGGEPLWGEICHVLGNRSLAIPQLIRRYPELTEVSDERFIETVQ